MSTDQPVSEPVRTTLVVSEACHFCEDAHRALAELAATYPIAVETVDVRSETGQRLMQTHRAPMSPLALLDGDFFSHGRLPRRKLAKVLAQRRAATASTSGSQAG